MRILNVKACEIGGRILIGFSQTDLELIANHSTNKVDEGARIDLQEKILRRIAEALRAIS